MRAVVTGAAGFIGSTLVDRLLADGHQVVGIDNFRTGLTANLEHAFSCNDLSPRRFTLVQVDIQAPEVVDIVAGANPHVIFHLAAQVDVDTSVPIPNSTRAAMCWAPSIFARQAGRAGVRRIVYAASGESRYGTHACLPVEKPNHVDPHSPHAVGKLAGEMYLRAYAEMYGLAPICLALANGYGPRQYPHVRGRGDRGSGQRDDHRPALRGVPGRRCGP